MKVQFCAECRRIILATFSFCPYCGSGVEQVNTLDDTLNPAFSRLEHGAVPAQRIDRLIEELEAMDRDLEELLAALESPAR